MSKNNQTDDAAVTDAAKEISFMWLESWLDALSCCTCNWNLATRRQPTERRRAEAEGCIVSGNWIELSDCMSDSSVRCQGFDWWRWRHFLFGRRRRRQRRRHNLLDPRSGENEMQQQPQRTALDQWTTMVVCATAMDCSTIPRLRIVPFHHRAQYRHRFCHQKPAELSTLPDPVLVPIKSQMSQW